MMFCVPAAVAASIVACRSFVSLTNYLRSDVDIYSTTTRRNTPRCPRGGTSGGDVIQVCACGGGCASDSSVTKTTGSAGNIPVGITFCSVGTSVNSTGQGHDVEELDVPRTISVPSTADSKPGYDFGGAGGGDGAVHVDMTMHRDANV
jgi:hypothetical protein